MIYNYNNPYTWPRDGQDVQIWSSNQGFTHGTFYEGGVGKFHGFDNWSERASDDEDADYLPVTGTIEWWSLRELEKMT
ncbi:MAG: hypothetical protein JKY45_02525 [Emcibacter sp.]|nr:hypothetical protein [Emcibacter sp.]